MSQSPSDLRLLKRIFSETRGYRLHIIGLFALSVVSSPLALLAPLPLKMAIDSSIGDRALPGFFQTVLPSTLTESKTAILGFAVLLMVAVALLSQLQSLCASSLRVSTGERMVLD